MPGSRPVPKNGSIDRKGTKSRMRTQSNDWPGLEAMEKAVREAGEIAMFHFGKVDCRRSFKGDGSLVTEADVAVERFLRKKFTLMIEDAGNPDTGILGEEDACGLETGTPPEREGYFIIDPIDGTATFSNGLPFFTICAGYLGKDILTRGVVYFPALDRMFTASRGGGAFLNGQPVKLNPEVFSDGIAFANGSLMVPSDSHLRFRISLECKTRSLGSLAAHVMETARSSALGTVCAPYLWDIAGAAVIVEEAGGTIRRLDGKDIRWRSYLGGEKMPFILVSAEELWEKLSGGIRRV